MNLNPVIVILLLTFSCFPQELPDSALSQLARTAPEAQDNLLLKFSIAQTETDPQLGVVYALRGIELSKKQNDTETESSLQSALGHHYSILGKYQEGISAFKTALSLAQTNNNTKAITYTLNNIANIYSDISAYDKALEYYLRALKSAEAIEDTNAISLLYSNLGNIYGLLGNAEKEIEFYLSALKFNEVSEDVQGRGIILGNLGLAYIQKREIGSARIFLDSALTIYKSIDDSLGMAEVYGSYGELYIYLGNLTEALKNYSLSLNCAQAVGDVKTLGENYLRIGSLYHRQNKPVIAGWYARRSFLLASETGNLLLEKNALTLLLKVYDKSGNKDSAYIVSRKLVDVTDSLSNAETNKQLNNLLILYDTEQKENQIIRLHSEKELISLRASEGKRLIVFLAVITFVILIAFVVALLLFRLKNKLTKELALKNRELEVSEERLKQALADKDKFISILAHDLRNPFNAMLPFTEELRDSEDISVEERKLLAGELFKVVSSTFQLLQNLLLWAGTQSGKMHLNPEEFSASMVLDNTHEFFLAQSAAKQIRYSVDLRGDSTVFADIETVHIVLRNLVGNAIKFTPSGGTILVTGSVEGAFYRINVADTGYGISKEKIALITGDSLLRSTEGTKGEKGAGIGLTLCKEFIALNKGTLTITSEPEKGSVFSFTLPKFESVK